LAKLQILINSRLSTNEILRKTIHISGFLVPLIFVRFFNTYLVSISLFLVMIVYMTSEVARKQGINFPLFSTVTRNATTSIFEINHFATAPITFTLGIIISLLIFPPPIAYAAIAVLTLGDGFANIFGRIFGKTPLSFNRKKTIEGTICGLICAFLGTILFVNPIKSLIAVTIGMLAESLPLPMNDNLVIPLSSGISLTVFSLL
jgi:dolichol kinase